MLASPHPTRRLTRALVATLAVVLVVSACSSSKTSAPPSTASPSTTAASSSPTSAAGSGAGAATIPASFYEPPSPLPGNAPGDVIRSLPIAAPPGTRGFAVLYRSTAADGSPTAVSGVVYVPTIAATGPRPIVAWAHGTTGLGDDCAPSKTFANQTAPEMAIVTFVAQQGLAFVATDYEGLGTPGPHPYLVNVAEGRNVLDAVRAAQRIGDTGVTAASDVVVWGHSQGGGAAAFAAELKPTYAPELRVVGALVGAPAADFGSLASAATSSNPGFGFVVMALDGFAAAYPDVSLDRLLTEKGRAVAATIATQCSDRILTSLSASPPSDLLAPAVSTDAALRDRLRENSAGYVRTDVPIFLYHGDADTVVPPDASKNILDRYCAIGVNAARKVYPGADHVSVILAAVGDITAFVQARLAGQPATPTC